jgi:hypothetical protein
MNLKQRANSTFHRTQRIVSLLPPARNHVSLEPCMPRPTFFAVLRNTFLLALAGLALRAYAQEPTDNDLWKSRCTTLAASARAIDEGSAPPALLQTTKGIPGAKFAAVAHERGSAGQHYIACTLYYTAAIASYQGNGGKVDPSKAHTFAAQAAIELKQATGQPLTFKEKMGHTSHDMKTYTSGSLTPADIGAVFGAFGDGPPPVGNLR